MSTTLAMNVEANAVTQYMNYMFDSMCEFQGVPLGANKDGVFRLDAPTDGGEPITWDLTLATTDYKETNLKRFRNILVGLAVDDDVLVRVNDEVYNIKVTEKVFTYRTLKVPCRRKHTKSRYFAVSVGAVSGSRLALDAIDGTLVTLSTKPRR